MTPVNSCTPETYYSLSVADEPGLSVNDVGGAMKFTTEDTPEAVRWINRSEERRVGKECRSRWSRVAGQRRRKGGV